MNYRSLSESLALEWEAHETEIGSIRCRHLAETRVLSKDFIQLSPAKHDPQISVVQILPKDLSFQVRENKIVFKLLESRCIRRAHVLSGDSEALLSDLKVGSENFCIVQQSVIETLLRTIAGYLIAHETEAHDHEGNQETVNPYKPESEGIKVH